MEDPRTDELETPVVFGGIYDPEATLLCRDKVGQELTLTFGAKFDRSSSVPITAKGTVLAYIKGWNKFHGVGDIALFRSCGVDIVLSENHIGYGLACRVRRFGKESCRYAACGMQTGLSHRAAGSICKTQHYGTFKGQHERGFDKP